MIQVCQIIPIRRTTPNSRCPTYTLQLAFHAPRMSVSWSPRCRDHAIIDDRRLSLLLTKVASMTGPARLNSVPKVMKPVYEKIDDLTDHVCDRHLNSEYRNFARSMTGTVSALIDHLAEEVQCRWVGPMHVFPEPPIAVAAPPGSTRRVRPLSVP